VLVPNATEPPAGIVTSDAGVVMTPDGCVVVYGESWMNSAFDGTPALSSRNSM
jgi:hypothetical protein